MLYFPLVKQRQLIELKHKLKLNVMVLPPPSHRADDNHNSSLTVSESPQVNTSKTSGNGQFPKIAGSGGRNKISLSALSSEERLKYRKKAFALFKQGFGYKAVASKLQLSVFTVKDWDRLYKGGYFKPEIKKPGNFSENVLSADLKEQVRKEFNEGASVCSLSVKYGKSKSTIRYWIKNSKNRISHKASSHDNRISVKSPT